MPENIYFLNIVFKYISKKNITIAGINNKLLKFYNSHK